MLRLVLPVLRASHFSNAEVSGCRIHCCQGMHGEQIGLCRPDPGSIGMKNHAGQLFIVPAQTKTPAKKFRLFFDLSGVELFLFMCAIAMHKNPTGKLKNAHKRTYECFTAQRL